jgi:deazaflavin-dependent oxidoreductase (nitroreductase family)
MAARSSTLPEARRSRTWNRVLPVWYRLVALANPLVRRLSRTVGIGNVVELRVVGRRSGALRGVVVGVLRDGDQWFLGHPNGHVAWTRNLEAAGVADIVIGNGSPIHVTARLLEPGELRDRAILSTDQHLFPGNLVYRLARAHTRAVGVYFAIDQSPGEA